MTKTLSIGQTAESITKTCGAYVPPWKVARCVRALIARGSLPEHLVGRQHFVLSDELALIVDALGLTVAGVQRGKTERDHRENPHRTATIGRC